MNKKLKNFTNGLAHGLAVAHVGFVALWAFHKIWAFWPYELCGPSPRGPRLNGGGPTHLTPNFEGMKKGL